MRRARVYKQHGLTSPESWDPSQKIELTRQFEEWSTDFIFEIKRISSSIIYPPFILIDFTLFIIIRGKEKGETKR